MHGQLRTAFGSLFLALGTLIVTSHPAAGATPRSSPRHIRFMDGTIYGPGHMADNALPPGRLSELMLSAGLDGRIDFFNNGAALPNVEGETTLLRASGAKLSNGRPFNERTDGGIIEVGRGAMRFLNVTAGDGSSAGVTRTHLDADFNWHLKVDLALDPGFAEGVIVIDELDITSGVVQVPRSQQSVAGMPGGIDRAGSLAAGTLVAGRAGDYDHDGFLDGIFVGAATIPLQQMFLPGAPVVQRRTFTTDIPIKALDAALLATVSAANLQPLLEQAPQGSNSSKTAWWDELVLRIDAARRSLESVQSASRQLSSINAAHALALQSRTACISPDAPASPQPQSESCTESSRRLFEQLAQIRSALAPLSTLRRKAPAA